MRDTFLSQLETLHTELIRMGALCEDAISTAVRGLIDEDDSLREKVNGMEMEIDRKEHEIESFCLRLLIREQPVAGDLRQVHAAMKLIANMERVGDQAADIADIALFMKGNTLKNEVRIMEMANAAVAMLQKSVDSFVENDIAKAREVIEFDDVVDEFFIQIKNELSDRMVRNSADAEACLDILMIAKYLERIGDHAENIAEEVLYTITGERGSDS